MGTKSQHCLKTFFMTFETNAPLQSDISFDEMEDEINHKGTNSIFCHEIGVSFPVPA